ncbi:MAG: ABC transporter permease, partial [Chloroflexota bacterium]
MRRLNQTRTISLLISPAVVFMVVFFVVPLCYLLTQSLRTEELGFTLQGYTDFFASRTSRIVYWRTLRIGLLITLICAVIAYPASFVIARAPARYRSLAMSLVILPLMTNAVARTYAWLIILGRQGILNETMQWLRIIERPVRLIFTEQAIVLGLSQLFLPLMVLPLVSAMENIPDDVIEAARSLGANQ